MATELPSSSNSDAWQLTGRTRRILGLGGANLSYVCSLRTGGAAGLAWAADGDRFWVALGAACRETGLSGEAGVCWWCAWSELLQLIFKRIWSR